MNGGVHGGGEEEEEEEELQEIGGEVFEASQFMTWYSKRKKGYTQLEDEVLIRAWEAVSLDAIHGTDQTGKIKKELTMKRSQEKEDKWHQIKKSKLRKAAIEDKRAQAEKTKALAKENKIMIMNRNEMDDITLEWHDLIRKGILERRRTVAIGGGGGGGASWFFIMVSPL
ncbi:Galactoside 2-alpha-L-fucosyltransferase [Hordeum vulgare]|nr:Galactoside 2-alpha-L-fucosyltransferase [Hordeum vulgare]